jgi:thiol-disulfide isomerase/thioredoxin
MRLPRSARRLEPFLALVAALQLPPLAQAQAKLPAQAAASSSVQGASAPNDESVQAINDDYDRKLLRLDRDRLERLARLAARQKPADAASTYEQLFRLGIAGNLFRDVEAAADAVVKDGSPSPTTLALAHLTRVIARADRGAYDESLDCLRQVLAQRESDRHAGGPKVILAADEVVGITDAYYQRMVHDGQYEIARKAFRLALDQTPQARVKDYLRSRLARLEQVGKPAPAIRGADIDAKPFDLAASKGKVVLVVFWASWHLPCAAEVSWLEQVYDAYRGRGFEIVGINLDAADGSQRIETLMPGVRRFLIDYNVRWPNLVSGSGGQDYARAYGITSIPANVLIDREGTVVQLDLVRKNIEPVLSRIAGP